ncbi:MAG: nucleoside-triphosphatase [Vicinamibacterales bacterium]
MSVGPAPVVWKRAAIYGSLWAASEIVVGSFLHNLRIPFAGSFLAAFGVLVMTAGHRSCPERGLIWRSAVVCALMKSISPSAVILGPMVGIAMEGVLLEACVRLLGGHAAGYLVGGALAVSWSMVQRMLTALIAFGPDVVRLYVEAYNFASRSLGVTRFGPFDLIATLIAAEWVVGATAAALGLSIARRATRTPAVATFSGGALGFAASAPIMAEGSWSIGRLGLVSAALLGGMAALTIAPLWFGAMSVAAFAAFVLKTYPRASARVRRPMLWVELAGVMLLAGLLLGGMRHGASGLAEGLQAGLAMVLRAVLVLFGFTAVSVELRNPVILSWVERRRMRGLSDALGVAFGALPAFTAVFARPDVTWRRPAGLAAMLIAQANALAENQGAAGRRRLFILSGDTGSGKTTRAAGVVEGLRARGQRVAGILAPGLLDSGRRTGFDIVNLASGESAQLARENAGGSGAHAQWSRFAFAPEGLALGRQALGPDSRGADVVVVDEVGPFELAGGGWAPALDDLMRGDGGPVVLVARSSIVDAVRRRWGSAGTVVWDAAATPANEIVEVITKAQELSSP